jgi:hypothetical protein
MATLSPLIFTRKRVPTRTLSSPDLLVLLYLS